jgi:hypothetical protein
MKSCIFKLPVSYLRWLMHFQIIYSLLIGYYVTDFGHATYSEPFLCTSNFSPIFFSTSKRISPTVFGINTIKI